MEVPDYYANFKYLALGLVPATLQLYVYVYTSTIITGPLPKITDWLPQVKHVYSSIGKKKEMKVDLYSAYRQYLDH